MADVHRQLEEKYAWSEASGLPRPAVNGLGFMGAPQHGYGPEMWGIDIEQLNALVDPITQKYFGKIDYLERETKLWSISARTVVEDFIKPATAGKGMGYALMVNQSKPLRAQVMVSHAWDESYCHFVRALEHASGPFWVCFASIYQCGDGAGPSIAEQLSPDPSTGPFGTVLKSVKATGGYMAAIITSACNIYTRMWCVYEMYEAMELSLEVKVLQPGGMGGVFRDDDQPLMGFIREAKVDCAAARCGPPGSAMNDDELAIRAKISQMPGGFAAIDRTVERARLETALEQAFRCAQGMGHAHRSGKPKETWLERDARELQRIVDKRLGKSSCCASM